MQTEHFASYRLGVLLLQTTLLLLMPQRTIAQDPPQTQDAWEQQRDGWLTQLREGPFKHWPDEKLPLKAKIAFDANQSGVALRAIDFQSNKDTTLRLYISHYPGLEEPDLVVLNPLDAEGYQEFLATMRVKFEKELGVEKLPTADEESFKQMKGMYRSFKWSMAYVAPAVTSVSDGTKEKGVDQLKVWDIRRAIQTLRTAGKLGKTPLWLQSQGDTAKSMLVASLFEPDVTRLDLYELPTKLRFGSEEKIDIEMPQIIAAALERSAVVIYEKEESDWSYVKSLAKQLKWNHSLQVRKPPSEE